MTPPLRLGALAAAISCLLVLFTGCAAVPDEAVWDPLDAESALEHAQEHGYHEAEDALADGVVTRDEWSRLHMGLRQCFENLGYEFDPALLDPIGQMFHREKSIFQGEGPEPSEEIAYECFQRYEDAVATRYVNDNQPIMDPQLLSITWECLDERSVEYTGEETNFRDFFPEEAGVGDARSEKVQDSDVAQCVRHGVHQMYPDAPYYAGDFFIPF